MDLFIALLALSLGSMHLGGAVAFLIKVFWGQDLNIIVYGFLTYIHIPFGLSLAIYLGYNIFNPALLGRAFLQASFPCNIEEKQH